MMGIDLLLPDDPNVRFYGVTIGVVTNIKDPDGVGRIKVKFPWLSDEDESAWARVMTPMAGEDRGFYFLPEVDDEVLVAFEHGDIAFPYILGSLWNGKDKPPLENDDGENNIRMIKSRSGHKIVLDDTEDKEKIIIEDKSGKNIITIDCEKNSLSVQIEEDINIEAKGKITIKSTDKDIAIECKNLEIKTQQECKIEAGSNCSIEAKSKAEFAAKSGLEITCAAGVKVNNGALEVM
ncbi:phage baseplate assembly protein V [Anabaenopsis tanganyikae CS-531]|uniref:Phage baseplate assembly protein V n=2 Tax=Anabaenopsis TaxID=110103 RepID=A0ABT5ASD1_9CYAN|nr:MULTISPECIES: phage baseplate assembly protein V [Anabaenopsis]MDB9540224.1 phage baseplate assembly protein V [Anabaenopsis arnoldii]MDH6092622.1 phage baseplate assembly protein V [Anabaenopsis arnoldii]MDH6105346.1 phage baseplate assembly protein V [Anabaenopsis tanganyikae CS-531]